MSAGQLKKKFIGNDEVGATKIRLENNSFLRGRNAANSGDISGWKINASDKLEAGVETNMGGFKITNLGTPTVSTDAATKQYVDSLSAGLAWKDSVRAATTAALPAVTYANGSSGVGATLTADANGALAAQDGITLVASDRLLVKDQASGLQNGLYEVTQVGDGSNPFILTRVVDADTAADLEAAAVFVEEGTTNGDSGWVLSTDNPTIGTTALSFVQFTGAGAITAGAGLTKTGNTLDVGAGDGITVNANDVAVNTTAIAGTGLENDGSNNLRIAASAAGDGIQGGAGSALSLTYDKEKLTLNATDISNGYKDLAQEALVNSVHVHVLGGLTGGEDATSGQFTTSVQGGVTRITFTNDWASGGDSALADGDILFAKYIRK